MVRIQLQLTDEQADALKRLAARDGVSKSEIVRRALDEFIHVALKKRAIAAAGSAHADVTDLSTRHDDYLADAHLE